MYYYIVGEMASRLRKVFLFLAKPARATVTENICWVHLVGEELIWELKESDG